jgi:hypothetical protein
MSRAIAVRWLAGLHAINPVGGCHGSKLWISASSMRRDIRALVRDDLGILVCRTDARRERAARLGPRSALRGYALAATDVSLRLSTVLIQVSNSHSSLPATNAKRLRKGAQRRSNPSIRYARYGLLRGACHRARIRATRWLAMTTAGYHHHVRWKRSLGRSDDTGSFL